MFTLTISAAAHLYTKNRLRWRLRQTILDSTYDGVIALLGPAPTAKFKFSQYFLRLVCAHTTQFKDHQYFQLYGISHHNAC